MVKLTPAHDANDFDIAQRTGLEMLNVMTPEASMNDNVPKAFQGMDRFDARKAVVAALAQQGLVAGEDEHAHSLPQCYRCDTVVEPRLSLQWFVKMKPLAEPALRASQGGTITFTPSHWQRAVRALDGEHPGLVYFAAALVGAPDPGVVLRLWRGDRLPRGPERVPEMWIEGARAGP